MKIEKNTSYYGNGNIRCEWWHKEGDTYYHHREDGPAIINYYESGEKNYEAWWVNSKKHRIEGPAHINYYKDGTIWFEYYLINGEEMSKEEWEDHPIRQEYLIKEAMKEALKE